jgi:UrcA family protein
MILRSISLSIVALGAAALCSPASSEGFWHMISHSGERVLPTTSATVSYADLDVSQEPGAKVLLARIKAAAEKVCGPRPSVIYDFVGMDAFNTCTKAAVENGVKGTNQALLIDLYHSGGHGLTGGTKK